MILADLLLDKAMDYELNALALAERESDPIGARILEGIAVALMEVAFALELAGDEELAA